jgi:DNA-binding GntR family transcriptional regulator
LKPAAHKLSVGIVEYLRNEILRGTYPPGSKLPEIPLSQRFNTSRTVVREALRILGEIGLVTLNPHRRATVTSPTPRRVRELFSLRAVLEAFALKLCMTEGRLGRPEIDEIERRYEVLKVSVQSGDAFSMIEADMGLHWALCAPCGHELLLDQLSALQTQTRACIFLTKFYGSDVDSEIEAHAPILAAVRSCDTDRAEAAMRNHISSAGERLLIRMTEVQRVNRRG